MLSSESIMVAIHQPSGKIIHINNALNGLACECICQECGQRFEAIQGRKRKNHFRHHMIDTNCRGGIETALHKLAKQILVENSEIILPKYGRVTYQDAISEKSFGRIIPDVSAKLTNGENIFFEIFHTHKVDDKKGLFFRKGLHKSIEIDMKSCPTKTIDEIKNFVLEDTKNKTIIFWELNEILIAPTKDEELSNLMKVAIFAFCFLLIEFLFPKTLRSLWNRIFA